MTKSGFKLLTTAQILSLIKKVGDGTDSLAKLVHEAAVQCLAHAKEHGDVTLFQKLVEALPKGYYESGIGRWVFANSPIRRDPKSGAFKLAKEGTPGYRGFNVEAAEAQPWWNMPAAAGGAREIMLSLESFVKLVKGLRGRAERAEAAGKIAHGEKTAIFDFIEAEEDFISNLKLPKVGKVVAPETRVH